MHDNNILQSLKKFIVQYFNDYLCNILLISAAVFNKQLYVSILVILGRKYMLVISTGRPTPATSVAARVTSNCATTTVFVTV